MSARVRITCSGPCPAFPYPLGASLDAEGVNFALYSEHATHVELCLFDDANVETRISIHNRTAFVWHIYVTEVRAGARYGYRVHGPYDPERGMRFNPNVVLLDPAADLRPVDGDQLGASRGVVVDPEFDWEDDVAPATPLHRSVVNETHVRGLTMRHPQVPAALRGTYAGVAHPAITSYLKELGITAIELMPVHAFIDELHLLDRGLRNYWGYSSIGFFAPDTRYRSGSALGSEVNEFKSMVKALHRAASR